MKNANALFLAAAGLLATAISPTYANYTFTTIDHPLANATQGTHVYGISGNTIVGTYVDVNNHLHVFTETAGVFTTLDDPQVPLSGTNAMGISGNTVVGYYSLGGVFHGFSETNGVYTQLDDPLAATTTQGFFKGTFAYAISGSTVVGAYEDAAGADRGFSETNGVYTLLDYPTATDSESNGTTPYGISGETVVGAYGQVIGGVLYKLSFLESGGNYTTPNLGFALRGISGDTLAGYGIAVFDGRIIAEGHIYNAGVDTLLDDPLGLTGSGTFARGVDGTTVVGYYEDAANDFHGFIATLDVPEPTSLGLLGIGVMGLSIHKRKTVNR